MNKEAIEVKVLIVDESNHEMVYPLWERLTKALPSYHFNPFGQPLMDEQKNNLLSVLKACVSKEDAEVFVALTKDGCICGTIAVVSNIQRGYEKPNSGVLFNLWVEASMRRQQVGTVLVQHAKKWLIREGANSVQAGWHPDNEIAHLFWSKQGFRSYELIAALTL